LREQICVLDEFAMRSFPPLKISFAQIHQFKGLENDVVILVDVAPPDRLKKEGSIHYIAMSRPRSLLSMIFTVINSEQDHKI
jgi:superfamily I DNA/RNA helicase